MKTKAKRIAWIAKVAISVLMITLISSCYLKNDNEPTFQYYDQGKNSSSFTENALSEFASSVKKVDGQAESHYKMALHFQRNRRHKLAIEELNNALQQDPAMAKAYNAMGVSYDKLRENSQAIHCYQLALKIDSDLDYVHNNLGYSYLHISNLDAAIVSFKKAIQLNDENKRYHNNLALAYVMNDRYDLAIDQLKSLEGGPHAGETVAKLAQRLGKKDFEKQIVSALLKIESEKTLVAKAKPVPSKPTVISKKINGQDAESDSIKPVLVRRKIKYPAPGLSTDIKGLTEGKSWRRKIQTGSTPVLTSQNPQHNATAIEIFPKPVGSRSETGETRIADITEAGYVSELVAADGPVKKDSIVSPTDESKNIYAHKHIRVMWEDSVDSPQVLTDTAPVNPASDIQHLKDSAVTHKQTIRTEDSLQKQDKESHNYFDEPLHLSAFEMVSEPPTEKPQSVSHGLQDSDAKTSIKNIKKETAHRPQPRIKPKVIDVVDVFKPAGKESENTMPVISTGKLEIVGQSDRVSKTRKISPVYATSALPSEKIEGKGLSIIVVSPSRKDKKITRAADSTEEIKTEKRGQEIVELEIANGNGVNGMARRLQYFLKERGFKVVKITNANTFDHLTTKILYYTGHRKDVGHLIEKLAFSPDERGIIELKNFGHRIKIIIGKDIMRQNEVFTTARFTRN